MPRVSAKIHKFLKELALTSDEKAALREDIGAVAGADVVSDTAYNEATWNNVTGVAPSKNALRDKFEALDAAKLETAADVTTALQGAEADPTRIGTEYLPEALEVASVQLTDTGASSLPAGSLGLNSGGELIVHDNIRNGDDLPPLIDATSMQSIICNVSGNAMRNTSLITTLGRIKFPASVAANGKIIQVSGSLSLYMGLTSLPDQFIFFGFRNASNAQIGDGMTDQYTSIALPASVGMYKIRFDFLLQCVTGNLLNKILSSQAAAEIATLPSTPGAISTHVSAWTNGDDMSYLPTDLITIGQPIDLEFILYSYDTSNTVLGEINMSGFLTCGHS